MLFYVACALVAIAFVGMTVHWYRGEYSYWGSGFDVGGFFVSLLLGLLVAFLVALGAGLIVVAGYCIAPQPDIRTSGGSDNLRSIGDSSAITGHAYFLGGGYINEQRTLNYIVDDDGALSLKSAYAVSSTVFEDATNSTTSPRVDYTEHAYRNTWIWPWTEHVWEETTFHIPANSVLNDYSVGN